jgi:addiction module RelB/DinJ family antitoxin
MSSNTKTILNIKTEKSIKREAQKVAEELGIPLGTAINAFLKQFVREREITLSLNTAVPTPYLQRVIQEAEHEYAQQGVAKPMTGDAFIAHLKKL